MDETGLYFYILREKSIKAPDHHKLLKLWRKRLGHNRWVALFYDGLSFHHNPETHALLKSLKIFGLQNMAYSCQYNPIEQLWKESKYFYRRALLKFLSKHEG